MQLLHCYRPTYDDISTIFKLHLTWVLSVLNNLILQIYLTKNRRQRIQELLEKQEKLKTELAEAKRILMVDPTTWSYDRERRISFF